MRPLTENDVPMRALAHSDSSAEALTAQGIETVRGDMADPSSLGDALDRVERLFLLLVASPEQAELEGGVVDAAVARGVHHVVRLSVFGVGPDAPIAFARRHDVADERLRDTGVDCIFLRSNGFMQNTLRDADAIKSQGQFYAPLEDARVSFVDTRDVAAVGVRALTEDRPRRPGQRPHRAPGPVEPRHRGEDLGGNGKPGDLRAGAGRGGKAGHDRGRHPGVLRRRPARADALLPRRRRIGVSPEGERLLRRPPGTFDQFAADRADAFRPASGG